MLVGWNRLLIRLRLRRQPDGWRRGAGVALCGEAARFVLSAFNLQLPAAAEPTADLLLTQFDQLLTAEPMSHVLIRHTPDEDLPLAHTGPTFTLAVQPWIDGPARFIRPDTWQGQLNAPLPADTSPLFEFIARVGPERQVDLWVRINHVGIDGVPSQEILSRVERTWHAAPGLTFPTPESFAPFTAPRPTPGRTGIVEVQAFLDFAPLLAWRKQQNATIPEPLALAAAILWRLSRHPRFASLRLATTVELPATAALPRAVGVVVVQPSRYADTPTGLARYARDFNRHLQSTRGRTSSGGLTLDAAAYLPASLERSLLLHTLNDPKGAFGSVGLTIVKDAKVFGAPLGDAGHADGFIAIGGVGLPTADGRQVGCVVVKGPAERIGDYATVLAEALK